MILLSVFVASVIFGTLGVVDKDKQHVTSATVVAVKDAR